MKKISIIIIFFIIFSCIQNNNKVAVFSTTFGNALHGGITLDFDNSEGLLILKRVGSKRVLIPPPPPPSEHGYSKEQRDSISKAEQQYYLDYAQPNTAAYKLTKEEANTLNNLINSIPKEERKDFYPQYPMVDGFTYNFQIIYSDGKVEDAEIQHINIPSHEKIIYQMLIYAKKYEKDKNNIQVLKNFEDWNYPKY